MKILLLAGGDSSENQVSLASGKAVYASLERLGHEVIAMDPASGRLLTDSDNRFIEADTSTGRVPTRTRTDTTALVASLGQPEIREAEVVFIALHGGSGENGSIQNLLDLAGYHYTGSGMLASAVAMNKSLTKRLAESMGLTTPAWRQYRLGPDHDSRGMMDEIEHQFSFPVIVKPNNSGSTVGLTRVDDADGLPGAIVTAEQESSDILVEQYIAGREITAAVLDGRTFPLVEIKPRNQLYDYEAKYTRGKSEYICPAQLDEALAERIRTAAADVYRIIEASGLARVDFILSGQNEFYFLELNTLPGMTELSLAPMAAGADGLSFDQLISLMVKSALEK